MSLQIFKNESFGNIRVVRKEDEVFFVGKDIAESLGYANTRDAISTHVDEEDKADVVIYDGRQNRTMKGINESGLYSLILSSKLEGAKQFKRWVTSEVLPAIRKDGGYISTTEEDTDEMIMAKALIIGQKTIERQKLLLQQKDKIIQEKEIEIKEKNIFLDKIAASNTCILVRDLAHIITKKGFKIGERKLWEKLRELKIIQKGTTKPYQRYLEMGLFEINEYAIQTNSGVKLKTTTKVTGKGQVYIIKKLMEEVKEC